MLSVYQRGHIIKYQRTCLKGTVPRDFQLFLLKVEFRKLFLFHNDIQMESLNFVYVLVVNNYADMKL